MDLNKRKIIVHVLGTPILNTDKFDDSLMGEFAVNLVFEVLSFVAENERKAINQRQKKELKSLKRRA